MRILHAVLAAFAIAFVLLVVTANRECAPEYFQRGDVLALIGLAVVYAILLVWASGADTDPRRTVGSLSSVGLAALFILTASIPVLIAPVAVAGALRMPRSTAARWRALAAVPVVVVVTIWFPYLGQSGLTPDQFRCP